MAKNGTASASNIVYETADKHAWYDLPLKKTVLKLIPASIKPNHITVIRFITTPIVLLLMLYENYMVGLLAFLLVAFTDMVDGAMARTRGQITQWGRVYDPVADKVLVGSMVFAIVLRYIDWWTAIIIVGLEIIIIITAWVRMAKGIKVQANRWGKIKMFLQVCGVTILLISVILKWGVLLPFASGTLYLAIAFAIVSLLTYGI